MANPNTRAGKSPISTFIKLSSNEEQICDVVLSVATRLSKEGDRVPVIVRIAGGWVRDKLLEKESYDLDFALDNVSGFEFATAVGEYMEKEGIEVRHIGKIEQNPDKSKHLETATTIVFGQEVDFVNLRTEVYHEHSRIPVAEFGTPQQDAERRDITINSLFYNLHTRSIEDFTGKGLEDLENGYIRTPLAPQQTFLDDPLRVLRVIRFASRFGYDIDPEILYAAAQPEIKNAFKNKLSKERVGIELDKMLSGNDPLRALKLISEFGYYRLVFEPPASFDQEIVIEEDLSIQIAEVLSRIFDSPEVITKLAPSLPALNNLHKRLLYLCSALTPYHPHTYMEKKKEIPVVRYIVMNSMKLCTHDADVSSGIISSLDPIIKMVNYVNETGVKVRKDIGLLIREIGLKFLSDLWPLALIHAFAFEIAQSTDSNSFELLSSKYETFASAVTELNLADAHKEKYLLSGKDICRILNIKPSPIIGTINQALIEWQFENPGATKEMAETWILSTHSE
ncbi:CCA tRNA nucleotidyltransferase, mitochondrial [Nowakowskiella sp. JEL0407]|nr:CCA tRNA nucleotidyltransferase, mitochondrial [Nowakowskiella sp. JEL0407]